MTPRRKTKQIRIGSVAVGGGAAPSVQTMTNTDTRDVQATLAQIERCARAKCDIIRCAVPDMEAARAMKEICAASPLPVIADIHFDHRLALASLEAGAHGLRLNPGNIGGRKKVEAVAAAALERRTPIRIGVNSGSLSAKLRERVDSGALPLGEAMAESALEHARILEDCGFDLIKISLKASDVLTTVAAYRSLAPRVPYPFHAGITEAGTARSGAIKSAVGIGLLLAEGLVDTLRVSLTAPPEEEVFVGREILKCFGYCAESYRLISCPTCARTEINLERIVAEVERYLIERDPPLTVAVMGCVVNGPGEASHADIGIAGGRGQGVVYRKGKIIRQCKDEELAGALIEEIEKMIG
ncbi:MAG: flavodoxin-dependent (E)-4-hydroxy-3-methylbut-2-enyl-diphosphate synthase [Candidatus Sumerlaeota bacterium]|nr:flavodoxin-dependent (E)-4-hydroxy-3-methylbut-2-enyl-diphosphate synthase [Candidatus Sumerlaeota bacterium]